MSRSGVEILPPGSTAAPRAGATIVMVAVATGFVMAMLDVTIVNVALTAMQSSLSMSLTALVWVVDAYTLSFAALLLLGGSLANRFGAKPIYIAGLAIFVLASALCGLSTTPAMLIAARLAQGVGAALFMPSSLSLLTLAFPAGPVRSKMIGIWGALVSAAMALGPFVGGMLVGTIGWRSIFWVNLPVGLVGLLLTHRYVAPSPRHAGPLNGFGHLLGAFALAALSLTLIQGPSTGWTSPTIIGSGLATLLAAGAFVLRERYARSRILPATLLGNPQFVAASLLGLAINFAIFAEIFLLSLYLQQERGATPLETGFQLFPLMAMFAAGNLLSARVNARLGARGTLVSGLALAGIGSAILTGVAFMPYWGIAICVGVANLGAGQAIPSMNLIVLQAAGPADANIAAAALNANRQIGSLLGVALASVILHALHDANLATASGFAVIAAAYAGGLVLVMKALRPK
jgi:DHA2 family methylenomycin A resistance protein-like MFS transporter